MRPEAHPGLWARLPPAWTASPRRRRLAFLALTAPGAVMAVSGAQILVSPPLLVAGVVWLVAAVAVRRASEPRFLALETQTPPAPDEESVG